MSAYEPLHPTDNLYMAVCRLNESGQWSLPVEDEGRPVGTLTARSILHHMTMRHGYLSVPCLQVGEVMEKNADRAGAAGGRAPQ